MAEPTQTPGVPTAPTQTPGIPPAEPTQTPGAPVAPTHLTAPPPSPTQTPTEPTIKVINTGKCRRELTIDVQDYKKDNGHGAGRDEDGRSLQPLLITRWLEQGANEVPVSFIDKCRAHSSYIDGLFTRRILRAEPIKPAVVDDRVKLEPATVEDLSQLRESYAKKLIRDCTDPVTLRAWVDQDYRPAIRTALKRRWAELVPAESTGLDDPESV